MTTSRTDNAAAAPAAAFWTDLEQALGPNGFSRGADAIPPKYWTDWSGTPPVPPLALLRPRSTDEVSAVLRICHAHRVPVVPQGGLTGLAGAAVPVAQGVAVAMDRMQQIEDVNARTGLMTVQAGVSLQTVQEAAV
ncbi:MAG: FAD-binding oxidoreductase, partial [Comamonas sp.]|nr:FAD-binding oxidoreductase [Comamonas sp.]